MTSEEEIGFPISETRRAINTIKNHVNSESHTIKKAIKQIDNTTQAIGKLSVTSTELAIKRTQLANERTLLAYMRTGFGIAALSGAFRKWWICIFGITMIILSYVQYYIVNLRLRQHRSPSTHLLENLPMLYIVLAMGVLYLQWNKPKKR